MQDPHALLRGIVDREISVTQVVASRSVNSDQEAADMIKVLSKTAVEMHIPSVMDELGQTQSLGGKLLFDPLEGIPEAMPVLKVKVLYLSHPGNQPLITYRNAIPNSSTQQTALLSKLPTALNLPKR